MNPVHKLIAEECDAVSKFLIQKNMDYNNSFADPIGIFSHLDPVSLINARIDDKLKRIKNSSDKTYQEDTELDLIGYLILKRVLMKMNKFKLSVIASDRCQISFAKKDYCDE